MKCLSITDVNQNVFENENTKIYYNKHVLTTVIQNRQSQKRRCFEATVVDPTNKKA